MSPNHDSLAASTIVAPSVAVAEESRYGRFGRDTAKNEDGEEAKHGHIDADGEEDGLGVLPLNEEPGGKATVISAVSALGLPDAMTGEDSLRAKVDDDEHSGGNEH